MGMVTGRYYGTLVYRVLSSKEHTGKVYGDEDLKVDVARFSKYALGAQVQRRRFERVTGQHENMKSVFAVPARFCA